jgi:ADP-heptose:LPS heptosyltransferase/GT2 family glycosyltransferase
MASLFDNYALIAESGLFDPEYYIAANPDVAALACDPLLHYLEYGAIELRNPNPSFDARAYARNWATRGQTPENPLLHFIALAHSQKLEPAPSPNLESAVRLECDQCRLSTSGRVHIEGWAAAPAGIETVIVSVDGVEVGRPKFGLDRPDVGLHLPSIPDARYSGFIFDAGIDGPIAGEHVVSVRALAHNGDDRVVEVFVTAAEIADAAPERESTEPEASEGVFRIAIDTPYVVNGAAVDPIRSSLSLNGWALAPKGVASIDIAIDGDRIASAYYGVRRDDVAAAFPAQEGSLLSGFAALISHRMLPVGRRQIGLTLTDKEGGVRKLDFSIEIEEAPARAGPWSLRQKMPQAEVDLRLRILRSLDWRPEFFLILRVGSDDDEIAVARRTLKSLASQVYGDWRLLVAPNDPKIDTARLQRALSAGFDDFTDRITYLTPATAKTPLDELVRRVSPKPATTLIGFLSPGDELGVDALLEFASWSGFNRTSDLIYCDERRIDPGTGKPDAFFKPDWSPDLLLSTNYIGRLWCVDADLLAKIPVTIGNLRRDGEYDFLLRCTEAAKTVGHVPSLLCQRSLLPGETPDAERKSLERAIARRKIAGTVAATATPGTYQVKRAHEVKALVSIIIPTCGARGLIKTCLETLRAHTAYRNFEIVCIENMPAREKKLRAWLKSAADTVVTIAEPFNWSRYNNLAAAQAKGEYLLFLNDDIEIIDPDWLDILLGHAQRPEVGVVGPLLLYPDRTIQHAGLFLTRHATARHAFRFGDENDAGYFGLALTERNVIGVTGACLMTRRDTFETLGHFDEAHTVVNNDLDYCLRAWGAGLVNVFTPQTKMIHHELASRSEISDEYDETGFAARWTDVFMRGDPYYSPRLSKDRDDYSIEFEPTQLIHAGHPAFARESIERILVVKVDHIGDCVTALPAIRRLKHHFPKARLYVLSGKASRPIWSMEPAIDEVIEFEFFHARSSLGALERSDADWKALEEKLEPYRFDIAVDLRMHIDTRPVLRHTGARYLAGFEHRVSFPWLDFAVEWAADQSYFAKRQHVGDALVNLVDAIAAAADPDRRTIAADPALSPDALAQVPQGDALFAKPVICIHPAAGTPMRQWPPQSFTALIDRLAKSGSFNIAVIGGPDEAELTRSILDGVAYPERVWSLVGKTKLADLPGIVSACALFIGNNSGPHHIAAGLGVPTIGIHAGVTDAREWGPLGPNAVAINRDMTCAPCYSERMDQCHRAFACMRQLEPGQVYEAALRMLALRGQNG